VSHRLFLDVIFEPHQKQYLAMKTTLLFRLSLTLLCAISSIQVNAQEVGDTFTASNGIEYQITYITNRGTSKVKAIDYSGTSTSVVIPLIVSDDGNSYNVTAIGDEAFKQTYNEGPLTSIVIGNAVTSIGSYAFANNDFTSVDIPDSVTSIGSYAFSGNDIANITIPNSITSIGTGTFSSNDITSLTIPNSVTSIGEKAFVANNITSLTIPNSVASIGENAFAANDITSLTIGSGVTLIHEGAFINNGLTEVISLSENPATITSNVFDNGYLYRQLENIELTIPEGSEQAYYDAGWTGFKTINDRFTVLSIIYEVTNTNPYEVSVVGSSVPTRTEITIVSDIENPNNSAYNYAVTVIAEEAFYDHTNITDVTSENENPATLGNNAFLDNSAIHLIIPEGTTQAYIDAGWTGFITSEKFTLGDMVYEIINTNPLEVSIIEYTGTSTEVTIDTNVHYDNNNYTITAIGKRAFHDTSLTSVVFPNSVTSIEENAFSHNDLTSITIPDSVTSLGESAFSYNDLTSITIPKTVTYIGEKAFDYNDITTVISESKNPARLENNTFYNNNLITLTIPTGTTQVYIDAIWLGFASIIEDASLSTLEIALSKQLSIITNTNTLTITSQSITTEQVEIYAITGAKVASSTDNQIAINHLNTGVYIAKIYTNKGVTSKKFIKR